MSREKCKNPLDDLLPPRYNIHNQIKGNDEEGRRRSPQRAGGWCEPVEEPWYTGPGVFCPNQILIGEDGWPRYWLYLKGGAEDCLGNRQLNQGGNTLSQRP